MNKTQNKLVRIIAKDAVDLDWKVAFDGKANGNRHLFRVAKIIRFLCKNEGGNLFIAQMGGWVHDVSLAWGSDYDQAHVEKHTRKFLNSYKALKKEEIDQIIECATLHEVSGASSNIEAKIVHDADVLDKGGMLGVIRHIWKMTNMLENRVLSSTSDLKTLQKHLRQRRSSVYTNTSKLLMKNLSEQMDLFFASGTDSMKLMKIISEMAYRGVTSDKIAKFIIRKHPSELSVNLETQLNCSYLNNT